MYNRHFKEMQISEKQFIKLIVCEVDNKLATGLLHKTL